MNRARTPHDHRVFPIIDDVHIGAISRGEDDPTFDDSLSGRASSDLSAGSYIGNISTKRAKRFGIGLLALVFGILLLRIGNWQIVHGADFRSVADNNRIRTHIVLPNRGVITDRNGVLLAWNEPQFHLVAVRALLPTNSDERAARFSAIADILHIPVDSFETRYQESLSTDHTILLFDDVPYDDAVRYLSQHGSTTDILVELAARRAYVTNDIPTLSHVLGYTGTIHADEYDALRADGYRRFDTIGTQGIEKQYESLLRGTPGIERTEVDAQGHDLRRLEKSDAVEGTNLQLSLDARLTAAVEYIVEDHLQNAEVKRAAVVVSSPSTGEILSLVSYPSYDANMFTGGISHTDYRALMDDPNAPLFPRATQGEYPSGSTIKPMYSAAALMEGIITPTTTFYSTGGIWLGARLFPDWRSAGHGPTNVTHAIADSVNTFFYIIGGGNEAFQGLGLERLMQYAGMFGFGAKSGIDLPAEGSGFLPSKAWKEATKGEPWYVGDTYNVSIGQGDFLVTPVQMNRATAVFANGGNLVTPHLVKDAPVESTKIVPDDVLAVVRDGMRKTITYGSATILQSLPVTSAGKTGTAQWATGRAPHTWFTGFAPYENPEIVVTVIVEEGANSYFTTPIARDIFEWYFVNQER